MSHLFADGNYDHSERVSDMCRLFNDGTECKRSSCIGCEKAANVRKANSKEKAGLNRVKRVLAKYDTDRKW